MKRKITKHGMKETLGSWESHVEGRISVCGTWEVLGKIENGKKTSENSWSVGVSNGSGIRRLNMTLLSIQSFYSSHSSLITSKTCSIFKSEKVIPFTHTIFYSLGISLWASVDFVNANQDQMLDFKIPFRILINQDEGEFLIFDFLIFDWFVNFFVLGIWSFNIKNFNKLMCII